MKIGTNDRHDVHRRRDKRVVNDIQVFEFVEVTELFREMRYKVVIDVQHSHLNHVIGNNDRLVAINSSVMMLAKDLNGGVQQMD